MAISSRTVRIRVLIPVLLIGIMLLIAAGCARKDQPRPFKMIVSGYLMGQVDPCNCPGNPLGGVARRVTLVNQQVEDLGSVLVVDAGKFASIIRRNGASKTEVVLLALQDIGLDAINVTVRDVRIGGKELVRMQRELEVPFVSVNVIDAETKQPLFEPYRLVELDLEDGPMTVAVVGVTRGSPSTYVPPEFGIDYLEPGEQLVNAMRTIGKDVDVVVMLTDADRRTTAEWLNLTSTEAGRAPDLVVASVVHPTRQARVLVGQTPYVTTGRQGKYLDIVDVFPIEDRWDIRKEGYALNEQVPDDPETVEMIDRVLGDDPLRAQEDDEETEG